MSFKNYLFRRSRIRIFYQVFIFVLFPGFLKAQHSMFKFIENKNQWDQSVKYRANIPSGFLFLQEDGFIYSFYDEDVLSRKHDNRLNETSRNLPNEDNDIINAHAFKVSLVGINENVTTKGSIPYSEKHNYFVSNNPENWSVSAKGFASVTYQEVYNNIDLTFKQEDVDLKYEYIVRKGGNPKKIKMQYEGLTKQYIRSENLQMETALGTLIEQKPFSYQVINGEKIEVPSRFKLKKGVVTFDFPKGYNKNYDLVIDPLLVFSSFSGSISDNWGNTATYDERGNLYSGGTVFGANYPVTTGAFQTSFSGQIDIGILKYDSAGTFVHYITYLGGEFTEVPHSLVVSENNELTILGTTSSPDFPVSNNAYDPTFSGGSNLQALGGVNYPNGSDMFIFTLNESGTQLKASTFVGGTFNDGINRQNDGSFILNKNYGDEFRGDIIYDTSGNIYVATTTFSQDFPTTTGSYQETFGGAQDGIIMKFNNDLSNLEWSTFLGGSSYDAIYSIKLDTFNNVIVAGGTNSIDFNTTSGVLHETYQGGDADGFVSVISSDGDSLVSSTYLGTSNTDQVYFVDLDEDENIGVFGQTFGQYPISNGVFSNPNSGQFIHKMDKALSQTMFSTVIGSGRGLPDIVPTAFLLNSCSNIYITGWGSSISSSQYNQGSTNDLPITGDAFQSTTDGNDFYLAILSPDGNDLLYGTFMGGGSANEHVDGGTCRFDKRGIVYHAVCACGNSSFPTTPNAFSTSNNSSNCNNAAFKFDLATLKADFDVEKDGLCNGVAIEFKNVSIGGNIFLWDFGDGNTSDDQIVTEHTYEQPGTYVISLHVEDSTTCKVLDLIVDTLTIHPQNFSSIGDQEICYGESVQLQAGGGTSYQWSPAEGLNNTTSANPVASPTQTTTYQVTITNEHGCVADSLITVEVLPRLEADFDAVIEYKCDSVPDVKIINKSIGAETYEWDFGNGTTSSEEAPPLIDYGESGNYTISLRITNADGKCEKFKSKTINVPIDHEFYFRENVVVSDSLITCHENGVQLFASGAQTYEWSPVENLSDPNAPNPVANPSENTLYHVKLGNGHGCFFDTTVYVTVLPTVVSEFKTNKVERCNDFPVFQFEQLSKDAVSYSWDFGDGSQFTGENPNTHIYEQEGTYQISLKAFNQLGCYTEYKEEVIVEKVFLANAFTPNGDDKNQSYVIDSQFEGWKLEVYNRWGEKVFEKENYKDEWDGKDLPAGIYYYLLTSPTGAKCNGSINILR